MVRVGPDAPSGWVSADGVRRRLQQHDCFGSAQKGGVVLMLDGNVTFKNGTISKSKAVRAPPSRLHVLRRMLQLFTLCAAWLRTWCGQATLRAGHVACEPLHCCALRHDRRRADCGACAVWRMVRACHVVQATRCMIAVARCDTLHGMLRDVARR